LKKGAAPKQQGGVIGDVTDLISDLLHPFAVDNGKAPVSYGTSVQQRRPSIVQGRNGGINLKHREFVQDVQSIDDGFNCRTFAINPGLSRLFPWLSKIAKNYETYTFNSLAFAFVPACATDNYGSLMMVVDPDASDEDPRDKASMLLQSNTVQTSVWKSCVHTPKKADLQRIRQRYVRSGAYTGDIKTYDAGKLHVANQGCGVTNFSMGSLWCAYDVTLNTPCGDDLTVASLEFGHDIEDGYEPFAKNELTWVATSHFPFRYRSEGIVELTCDVDGFFLFAICLVTGTGTGRITAVTASSGTVTELSIPAAATKTESTFHINALTGTTLQPTVSTSGTPLTWLCYARYVPCPLAAVPPYIDIYGL
jgi:hypothetical protein